MVKRALLCGSGKTYPQINLVRLPLELDMDRVIQRLNGSNDDRKWESIDVIDDSNTSVFDGEKNKIILANELMPSKENIRKSISEIILKGTDLLLFYFSGHGDKIGSDFFMITYNEQVFGVENGLVIGESEKVFFTDESYIIFFNELLQTNQNLTIISIIDCCFSACICKRFEKIGKFLDRHIVICSAANETITDNDNGSFFTESVINTAKTSDTYLNFKTSLAKNVGTLLSISINENFNNKSIPF